MYTYVMSDIHGRGDAYFSMLNKIQFNSFGKRDKLYIIGDVIDRGPDGVAIMQHIKENEEHIELLMGNHELLMKEALETNDMDLWIYNGGYPTYEALQRLDTEQRNGLLEFIFNRPYKKEVSVNNNIYYLVHSRPYIDNNGLDTKVRVYEPRWMQDMKLRDQMLWGQMCEAYIIEGKTIVFGHRCTKHYQNGTPYTIYKGKGMIGIDCGCAYSNGNGQLGCLELHNMEEIYTQFQIN